MIDHHGHYLREGSTFQEEVRWAGIETRKQALDMLRVRARPDAPGTWLFNLMGWSLDQFTDDRRPFTREELDQVAPDHPVAVQEAYYRFYVNSRALLGSPLAVRDSRGYGVAEVTAGGIPLDEIDPASMASRRCDGLYLVGEMLDVDGRIGGFNFQWSWSSAWVAGRALARELG